MRTLKIALIEINIISTRPELTTLISLIKFTEMIQTINAKKYIKFYLIQHTKISFSISEFYHIILLFRMCVFAIFLHIILICIVSSFCITRTRFLKLNTNTIVRNQK